MSNATIGSRPVGIGSLARDALPAYVPAARRASKTRFDLDLVIPALNEEQRIGPTIRALREALAAQPFSTRLIIVDNGSVDNTAEVASAHASEAVPVEIIGCRFRGKGAAVRAGARHATAPVIGYCDADLATPPEAVIAGFKAVLQGSDVVIGSRRAVGAEYLVRQSVVRRVGSRTFNLLARQLVGPVSDTQCGFKLFAPQAHGALLDGRLDGFAFDVEVLARARRIGLEVAEIPVDWTDRDGSSFRVVADGLAAFQELLSVRRIFLDEPSITDEPYVTP